MFLHTEGFTLNAEKLCIEALHTHKRHTEIFAHRRAKTFH